MYGFSTFDKNASMSLMAVSVRDVSVSGSVLCLKGEKKKDIWSLNCEMNTFSLILSVHWAKTVCND